MTGYRLPNRGRVDHARPVSFSFDGKSYTGLAGDTLASALLADGVHLMGRSFKYHRRRGVVERDRALDDRGDPRRHGRDGALLGGLPVDVPGLLPPHRGLYAGVEGHGQVQGQNRPSAEMA